MGDTKAAGAPHRVHRQMYKHTNVACHAHKDLYPSLYPPFCPTKYAEIISAALESSRKRLCGTAHKCASNDTLLPLEKAVGMRLVTIGKRAAWVRVEKKAPCHHLRTLLALLQSACREARIPLELTWLRCFDPIASAASKTLRRTRGDH